MEECQKYFYVSGAGTQAGIFSGNATSGTTYYASYSFPETMRGTPAVTLTNVAPTASFATTVGTTSQISRNGFVEARAANATANGGVFGSSFVANAEL